MRFSAFSNLELGGHSVPKEVFPSGMDLFHTVVTMHGFPNFDIRLTLAVPRNDDATTCGKFELYLARRAPRTTIPRYRFC
jgi:hypothetical protein